MTGAQQWPGPLLPLPRPHPPAHRPLSGAPRQLLQGGAQGSSEAEVMVNTELYVFLIYLMPVLYQMLQKYRHATSEVSAHTALVHTVVWCTGCIL